MRSAPPLLALLALAAATGPADAPAPLRVHAMTFNIRYDNPGDGPDRWANRAEHVAALIADSGADFVGVQEAMPHQIAELMRLLPGHAHVGRSRDRDRRRGEACPVLYRADRWTLAKHTTFWLSDSPDEPGSTGWGNTVPRIATLASFTHKQTARRVTVLNTHFDHESQPARLKSAAMIAQRLEAVADAVIVTGDFNADEQNPAIGALRDAGWIDTFRAAHPDAADVRTYHAFKGERRGGKIDHVLVRKGVAVADAGIVHENRDGRYPSDHFPVWAIVEFQ